MPSRSKAPPPPVFQTGSTLPLATGADARPEILPGAACEPQPSHMPPDPPPGGWTLAEAAQALLPDLYAVASKASPNAWQAGPGEPNRTERDALRRAFARIMERGEYVADGIREQKLETIPAEIWRAATQVAFGLPREPLPRRLPGVELCEGYYCWAGVRVRRKLVAPNGKLEAEASQPAQGSSQQVRATLDTLVPVETEPASASPNGQFYDIEVLKIEYMARVARWKAARKKRPDLRPPSPEQDAEWAQRTFGSVGRTKLRALRREWAPESWKKPGLRSGSIWRE